MSEQRVAPGTGERQDSRSAGLLSSAPRAPLWLIGIALLVHVALSLFINLVVFRAGWLDRPFRATYYLASPTLLANLLNIGVVLGIVIAGVGRFRPRHIGLRRGDVLSALAVTLATWLFFQVVAAVSMLVTGAAPAVDRAWGLQPATLIIGQLVGQLFGNALYEETLFRGFLLVQVLAWFAALKHWPRWRVLWTALLVSQIVFALSHIPNRIAFGRYAAPLDFVGDQLALLLAGAVFAGVYLRTGNLLIAVGLHALANTPTMAAQAANPNLIHATLAVVVVVLMVMGPRLRRDEARDAASRPDLPPDTATPSAARDR